MNRSWILPTGILVFIFTIICCLCLIAVAASVFLINSRSTSISYDQPDFNTTPTDTPVVIRPTQPEISEERATQEPYNQPGNLPLDPAATLKTLIEVEVPINDVADIAQRLEGKRGIPPTLDPPTVYPQVGDSQSFWVTDTDTDENFQIQATLEYVTEHAYFWVQDGIPFDRDDLSLLAETFENQIYPTNREFFGSEWTPGVDGDPHLYILYTRGLGSGIAGYFSSTDSYHPLIQEYSNGHEMFVLNADSVALHEEFTYAVLAHEFQHMIHWYRDRNESTWMNEGFSDLAMFLNSYDIGGHDFLYVRDPDLQLNDWPNDPDLTTPHYGASFLFMTYFLDRFGENATQALVTDQANGMESIDEVLAQLNITDPLTGETIRADDVFTDWVLASYLQDPEVADGRYTYSNYPNAPQPSDTETIRNCDSTVRTRDVHQYGVDYIRLDCRENTTLHFEGSTQVGVLPTDPYSGTYAFWSNKGDESDMTLTRSFDLTTHEGPVTLTFRTWYDIEEDYDYVYLEASIDGENWEILTTPSGTGEDPTGANYGWGYNGRSGGGDESAWILEEVDISEFAGQIVQLRFEYITDAAVNGEGLLLDDVAIPEIGYFTDFEGDDGGWEAEGFARIQNALPQSFSLALISFGQTTIIERIPLSPDNSADIRLDFDALDEAVLVVSGTTRFTRQPAAYRFSFTP